MTSDVKRLFDLDVQIPPIPDPKPEALGRGNPVVGQLCPTSSLGLIGDKVNWEYANAVVIAEKGPKTVSRATSTSPSPNDFADASSPTRIPSPPPTVIVSAFEEDESFHAESKAFHLVRRISGVVQALAINTGSRQIIQEDAGISLDCWRMGGGLSGRSYAERIFILYAIASTILRFHYSGLAHQDLKPENIGVQNDGVPRIFDLGSMVRLKDIKKKGGNTCVSSPAYYPPTGRNFSMRSSPKQHDVYSLGVTIYEVMTKKYWSGQLVSQLKLEGNVDDIARAFVNCTTQEHITNIIENVDVEDIGPDLKDLLKKMLVLVPEKRITIKKVVKAMGKLQLYASFSAPLTKKGKPTFEERIGTAV